MKSDLAYVFGQVIEGRKSTGSFFTPKGIAFRKKKKMCAPVLKLQAQGMYLLHTVANSLLSLQVFVCSPQSSLQ